MNALALTILLCFFFGSAVMLPIYNKVLFFGLGRIAPFAWPLTATSLQLACVALLLGSALLCNDVHRRHTESQQLINAGWRRLVWLCALPAAAFAGVIALSNVGVQQVSVDVHVLLKSGEAVAIVV